MENLNINGKDTISETTGINALDSKLNLLNSELTSKNMEIDVLNSKITSLEQQVMSQNADIEDATIFTSEIDSKHTKSELLIIIIFFIAIFALRLL